MSNGRVSPIGAIMTVTIIATAIMALAPRIPGRVPIARTSLHGHGRTARIDQTGLIGPIAPIAIVLAA